MNEREMASTFGCSVERDGAGATVTASGEIDLASSPDLRRELQALLDDGVRRIVLDLEAVTFVDSSGLGVLVGVRKRIDSDGDDGWLRIRGLNGPVRKVFEITGLDEVFDLRD